MQEIWKLNWIDQKKSSRGRSVALGTFDGVHLGHQRLVQETIGLVPPGGSSCVFTFDIPPEHYFKDQFELLNSFEHKVHRLKSYGIEEIAWLPFSRQIASLDATEFVDRLLVQQLKAREVVCGFNYRFGKNRTGDVDYLRKQGAKLGFNLTVVSPVESQSGEIISSTTIRRLLNQGELSKAAHYLGSYPSYVGVVVPGQGRGRVLGFPTANLELDPRLVLPKEGVYLSWCVLDGKQGMPAVTSIGKNPTFSGEVQTIESFILDFAGDLYGKSLEIQFLARLRDVARYDSATELQDQIERDVGQAREMLSGFRLQGHRIVLE